MIASDFYEDDEPIDRLAETFSAGESHTTRGPVTVWASSAGQIAATIVGCIVGVPIFMGNPMRLVAYL